MNVQYGAGLPHFQSAVAFQRGHGLGGVLGKLIRSVVPFLKQPAVRKTLKRIGKTAVKTGVDIVKDKINSPQTNLRDSLRKRSKQNFSKLLEKQQKTRQVLNKKGQKVKLSVPKKTRKLDIFDFQ